MINSATTQETHAEQLARLEHEVDALRSQLLSAQKLANVGTMTAMVAHEFNNILTPIISYAQMAQKNPKLVAKALSHAANGGTRATAICSALLGVTSDSTDDQAEQIVLADLLAVTIEATAREPAKDGIELTIDIPDGLTLTTKPVELQQVLLNLIINARTAMLATSRPRRLTISAAQPNGRTVITISDTGVGVPPENMEKIFQPFFTTSGDSSGHGLGLAFCKQIIETLDGEISVESIPDSGATFTISLP